MGLELLKTGHDNLSQMALLVAVGDFHRFIQLAFAQRSSYGRGERTGLLPGGAVGHETVDHHADGPGGHDEQSYDDQFGQQTHLVPEGPGIPANGRFLQQPQRPNLHLYEHCLLFSPAS
jgi:hypothetical protein